MYKNKINEYENKVRKLIEAKIAVLEAKNLFSQKSGFHSYEPQQLAFASVQHHSFASFNRRPSATTDIRETGVHSNQIDTIISESITQYYNYCQKLCSNISIFDTEYNTLDQMLTDAKENLYFYKAKQKNYEAYLEEVNKNELSGNKS